MDMSYQLPSWAKQMMGKLISCHLKIEFDEEEQRERLSQLSPTSLLLPR